MQQAGCWGKNPPDYFNMKISFIYMASGYGRRFGSNKLYARLKVLETMIRRMEAVL